MAEERQAQLLAAMEALRTWVMDQRSGWPDRPPIGHAPAPRLASEPAPSPPATWTPIVTPIELPRVEAEPVLPVAPPQPVAAEAPDVAGD
jgi:hypothetical protein